MNSPVLTFRMNGHSSQTPAAASDGDEDDALITKLRGNPEAASILDEQGQYLLHRVVASPSVSEAVVMALLQINPAAAGTADKDGNMPLHVLLQQKTQRVWKMQLGGSSGRLDISSPSQSPIRISSPGTVSGVSTRSLQFGTPGVLSHATSGITPGTASKRVLPTAALKRLLLANPEVCMHRNTAGLIPVELALARGAPAPMIKLLLAAKPDSAGIEYQGRLLLHAALGQRCAPPIILLIMQAWPKAVLKKDSAGHLPIHVALKHQAPLEVLTSLLQAYPASCTMLDDTGKSLLHHAAAASCSPATFQLLVSKHPEAPQLADAEGNLPLHLACGSEQPVEECIMALFQMHRDGLHTLNKTQASPLHLVSTPRTAYVMLTELFASAPPPHGAYLALPDLLGLMAEFTGHSAWELLASAAVLDCAKSSPSGGYLPLADRHHVASVLHVCREFVLQCLRKRAKGDAPPVERLTSQHLVRLCGAPPDLRFWSPRLLQEWVLLREWTCFPHIFVQQSVGGAQLLAWIAQDVEDEFEYADPRGTLWKGLDVMGFKKREDKAALVAELTQVMTDRRTFETQIQMEPLYLACIEGNLHTVEYLLHAMKAAAIHHATVTGGDLSGKLEMPIDLVGGHGLTALMCALTAALPALQAAGAALTPLKYGGVQPDFVAVVLALLQAGASPTVDCGIGRTALHGAVLCLVASTNDEWVRVIDAMLGAGALINARDHQGCTPLHLAAKADAAAVIRVLCDRGALLEVTDNEGLKPVDVVSDSTDAGAAARRALSEYVQIQVEAVVVQDTVVPLETAQSGALANQFAQKFGLKALPSVRDKSDDAKDADPVRRFRVQLGDSEELRSLIWPTQDMPAGAAVAGHRGRTISDADTIDEEELVHNMTLAAHPAETSMEATGAGAIFEQKLNTLRALIEEVNVPHVPSLMLLMYEGLDFNTDEDWLTASYRLVFLCDDEDPKPCAPNLHNGYIIEAPGQLIAEVMPAVRVAACMLQSQSVTTKFRDCQVAPDTPVLFDLGEPRYPALAVISRATRPFLFSELPRPAVTVHRPGSPFVDQDEAETANPPAHADDANSVGSSGHVETKAESEDFMGSDFGLALAQLSAAENAFIDAPTEELRRLALEYQEACIDACIMHINGYKNRYKRAYEALAQLIKRTGWQKGDHGLRKVKRDDGHTFWVCSHCSQSDRYQAVAEILDSQHELDLVGGTLAPPLTPGGVLPRAGGLTSPVRSLVYPLSPFMVLPKTESLTQRAEALHVELGVAPSVSAASAPAGAASTAPTSTIANGHSHGHSRGHSGVSTPVGEAESLAATVRAIQMEQLRATLAMHELAAALVAKDASRRAADAPASNAEATTAPVPASAAPAATGGLRDTMSSCTIM